MNTLRMMLLACATSLPMVTASHAADQILAGAITARSGQKLEGVTVSAKREGSTITTSVYTDAAGAYVFPPLPAGKYRVWAQALAVAPPRVARRGAGVGLGRGARWASGGAPS